MTRARLAACVGLLLLAAACEDANRGGLGPRGTALPPPDPVADAPAVLSPAPATPQRPARRGR